MADNNTAALGALKGSHRRCTIRAITVALTIPSSAFSSISSKQRCYSWSQRLDTPNVPLHRSLSPVPLSLPRASVHGTGPCWGPGFTLLEIISLSGMGPERSQENGNQKVLPVLRVFFPTTAHQLYKPRHRHLSEIKIEENSR